MKDKRLSKDSEKKKLEKWREIVSADVTAYQDKLNRMDERERLYDGKREIAELLEGDEITYAPYVRNIVKELIECQINSAVPQPKVQALHREDEPLAKLVEDMLRNKLAWLPFPEINDLMERTVPTQGGGNIHLEWDENSFYGLCRGNEYVSMLHPKQVIPQAGVTSDNEDMDHITLKIPQTEEYIKQRYGKDVSGEEDASVRTADGESETAPHMVTQWIVYYKNGKDGKGKFSWVNDTVLEDLEDCQARHLRRCRKCGEVEPMWDVDILSPTLDGTLPDADPDAADRRKDRCPHCGGTFMTTTETELEVKYPIYVDEETTIEPGEKIPLFKPDIYSVFLQRNVSRYGQYLGDSDADLIADQQNAINRLYAKLFARLLNGGSYVTLPPEVKINKDSAEGKSLILSSPEHVNMIKSVTLDGDISQTLAMIDHCYDEAMKALGVNDSFLGRKDSTATSGKAKEFAAAQAAGRLESKRVMKNEMYSRLFEAIFQFELAYADDKRPVMGEDELGNPLEQEWNKWKFLKKDASGEWYWETGFLFTVDSTAPLAQNREAMWQEARSHFEGGAYGNPQEIETQIIYWGIMAGLHYPGAERAKNLLSAKQTKAAKAELEKAKATKEAMDAADEDVAGLEQQTAPYMGAEQQEGEML